MKNKSTTLSQIELNKLQKAISLHQQGQLKKAEAAYKALLKKHPKHPDILRFLASIAYQQGQLELAAHLITQSIKINPNNLAAYANAGNIFRTSQNFEKALVYYDTALKQEPHNVEFLYNRGNVLSELQRYQEALDSYNQALNLKPDYIDALCNRGIVLKELKRYTEAFASYQQALTITSDSINIHLNLGNTYSELKRYDEALVSYQNALKLNPQHTKTLYNRANIFNQLKRYEEAIADYKTILAVEPDYKFLLGDYLHTKMKICHWNDFEDNLIRLKQGIENSKKISTPLPVQALLSEPLLQKKAAHYYALNQYPSNFVFPKTPKYSHSKIKIAYVSSDFRNHPITHLSSRLFELHDRSRFEVIAFSLKMESQKDEMRLKLENVFDSFIDVSEKSDEQVVQLAREMELDIAVDLNGFTENCRTHLFAMRLAPIQISYLGFLGTMGCDYIDYLIADKHLIPKEHQTYYSEKIIYLPNSFQANNNQLEVAEKNFTKAELNLPEQGFVFCCFNNTYKITPILFDCWMRILHQVKGSILWLLDDNPTATKNLCLEAEARGINPKERLFFAKRLPMPEYLARHRVADLFLDTNPYNAGATASAALWSGLPVSTYLGETFSGRMGASLLNAVGLPELVAHNLNEYEALAIELASQSEKLAFLRQKLQDNRLSHPLFNTELFTQQIEAAYQTVYERYQNDLMPEHVYI